MLLFERCCFSRGDLDRDRGRALDLDAAAETRGRSWSSAAWLVPASCGSLPRALAPKNAHRTAPSLRGSHHKRNSPSLTASPPKPPPGYHVPHWSPVSKRQPQLLVSSASCRPPFISRSASLGSTLTLTYAGPPSRNVRSFSAIVRHFKVRAGIVCRRPAAHSRVLVVHNPQHAKRFPRLHFTLSTTRPTRNVFATIVIGTEDVCHALCLVDRVLRRRHHIRARSVAGLT